MGEEDDFSIKNSLVEDIARMMYANGDDEEPYQDTVEMMEQMVFQCIVDVFVRGHKSQRSRLNVNDVKFALRHNPRMLNRVEDLLRKYEEIERMRKQFDTNEYDLLEEHNE
eukprot:NODE_287_length_10726_cov_0.240614.p7 type:complete len:111 gc:universal NODE_287_length_10726_cov_0.240614:8289-8621(+)